MTYADELRALADKADALVQQNADRRECSVYLDMAMESIEGLAPVLRALADRLQGKVVVRPFVIEPWPEVGIERYKAYIGELGSGPEGAGATEAEAIANLQDALDAAERGEG